MRVGVRLGPFSVSGSTRPRPPRRRVQQRPIAPPQKVSLRQSILAWVIVAVIVSPVVLVMLAMAGLLPR